MIAPITVRAAVRALCINFINPNCAEADALPRYCEKLCSNCGAETTRAFGANPIRKTPNEVSEEGTPVGGSSSELAVCFEQARSQN